MREQTVKEKPAQTETENTEMYPLKSYVYRILHRKFSAAECAQVFDIIRVEKLRFTTRMSG